MARATRKSTVPADESKADKFKRLVNARARVAIKAMRGLAKLGTSAYERTPEDIDKLGKIMSGELSAMLEALRPRVGADKGKPEIMVL